jgi:hypothetical protein
MFLKPAKEGLIVRHPETKRPLRQEGEEVKKSSYWLRRLKEGSVIEASKKADFKKAAVEQPKKKDGGKS